MNGLRVLGGGAVLLIAVGLGGVLASLVTDNTLFQGTGEISAVPAVVTVLAFVVSILAFVAVGRPWKSWDRTPYW